MTSATSTQDGWVYFAGRTSDWLRVDGENFPATPIEAIIARHPDLILASVYGVPEPDSGDQVMCALVLRDGATFDGATFAKWLDDQPDLSPEVATPLRADVHGAADDTDQQGAGPHARAPEVPLGPGGRRPRSMYASGAATSYRPFTARGRARLARGIRGQRPPRGLGALSCSGRSGATEVGFRSS